MNHTIYFLKITCALFVFKLNDFPLIWPYSLQAHVNKMSTFCLLLSSKGFLMHFKDYEIEIAT